MTFQLDPTQDPPAIDLEYAIGKEKFFGRGIYCLTGDQLTICYRLDRGKPPRERSSQWVTHADGQETMFTLQREKAEPAK